MSLADAQASQIADRGDSPEAVDDHEDAAARQEAAIRRKGEAEARLAAALDVNRTLLSMLAARRGALEDCEATVAELRKRVAGHQVEDPARKAHAKELQADLNQPEPKTQRERRDAALLAREKVQLEAKIFTMNEENVKLAEKHRQDRTAFAEKQNKLRILGKRERELSKHMDSLAEQLNLTSEMLAAERGDGSRATDFRRLRGVCVGKLMASGALNPPPQAAPAEAEEAAYAVAKVRTAPG
mmetsp:Transcript_453/g.1418  ORF Transcript_453/g.1418 Transcript_453/m.1418 type:complete len:242 (-) Transcript_453:104-829(-)